MHVVTPNGRVSVVSKSSPLDAGVMRQIRPGAGYVPLLTKHQLGMTYEGMYRTQVWIGVVVDKKSKNVARLPWKVYEYTDAEEMNRQRVKDHPLTKLLSRPYPRASGWQLKEAIEGSLDVHGNALVVKVRPGPGRAPTELWPVPWRYVEVVETTPFIADHYTFWNPATGNGILLHPDDVIHYRRWGLGGSVGVSPMEKLRRTLAIEDAAQMHAAATFANGATPSGLFSTEKKLGPASGPHLRAELAQLYAGVENGGRFAILDGGMKYTAVAQSAVDTALIEMRKLGREEVAAAYDMPPPVIGILDRATFSNVSEQHQMLYVDTIGPDLVMIEQTTQAQLIDPEPSFQGVFSEFDLSAILQGDPEKRSTTYQKLLQGVYMPNELRRLENKPDVEGGDVLYMPANLIPIGASVEHIKARAALLDAFARAGGRIDEPAPARDNVPPRPSVSQ